jgi:hypothetical protein
MKRLQGDSSGAEIALSFPLWKGTVTIVEARSAYRRYTQPILAVMRPGPEAGRLAVRTSSTPVEPTSVESWRRENWRRAAVSCGESTSAVPGERRGRKSQQARSRDFISLISMIGPGARYRFPAQPTFSFLIRRRSTRGRQSGSAQRVVVPAKRRPSGHRPGRANVALV